MENTEIRFSLVRIDKKRQVHLSVKPAEWLLEALLRMPSLPVV